MTEQIARTENAHLRGLQATYEPLLWEQAGALSQLRTPLSQYQTQLYTDVGTMRGRKLNLYEQEMLAQKEAEYWRIHGKVQDIVLQENQIVAALVALEEGTIAEAKLQEIAPPKEKETDHVSKRRRRMLEENERLKGLGIDPTEIAWDLYQEFGFDVPRELAIPQLTTGRHRTGIRGNFDPESASQEFFHATADTHGGKVGHGKRGNYYRTTGGRKVRKA